MKWRKDKSEAEVKARVLQKFFEADKSPNAPVILDNAEFKVFQGMIRSGEFDLGNIGGEVREQPTEWDRETWERLRRDAQNIPPAPLRFRPYNEMPPKTAAADPCKPEYYKTTIKGVVVTPWDVIDALGLDFYLGNTLKYLWRFRDKGGILDLKKARTNLDKAIADLEKRQTDAGKAKA